MIWRWIDETFMSIPFLAFGGLLAEKLHDAYNRLFPSQHRAPAYNGHCHHPSEEESAKWRTISIAVLAKDKRADQEVKAKGRAGLEEILEQVGVKIANSGFDEKLGPILDNALAFAQTIAAQRCVYEVEVPALKPGDAKDADDSRYTNVDTEYVEEETEQSGTILYVGKPGLVRCGNPMGQELGRERVFLHPSFVMLEGFD
jgi:hypothetical protein